MEQINILFTSELLSDIPHIDHGFLTRNGGVSSNEFDSLNIKYGNGDSLENINNNKEIIRDIFRANKFITNNQVHSNIVNIITSTEIYEEYIGDAFISNIPNILIGVTTADCIPILIAHKKENIIACIHAGWKGTLNGIIENTISKITKNHNNNDFYVAIGPCIRQKSYKVGKDFYNNIINKDSKYCNLFDKEMNFDLPSLAKDVIFKMGIDKIDDLNIDTYSNPELFFSYRRSCEENNKTSQPSHEAKTYGAQASVIMLKQR